MFSIDKVSKTFSSCSDKKKKERDLFLWLGYWIPQTIEKSFFKPYDPHNNQNI